MSTFKAATTTTNEALLTVNDVRQAILSTDAVTSTKLPRKPKLLAIFGSVDFYGADSEALCQAIGRRLAESVPDLILVTGANAIVQDVIAKSFCDTLMTAADSSRQQNDESEQESNNTTQNTQRSAFHLTPMGCDCTFSHGTVLTAGRDMEHRRQLLASCASAALSVEGGPGTADEMWKAAAAAIPLIPVGRSGGASSSMFDAPCKQEWQPEFVTDDDWKLLWDKSASPDDTALTVARIVKNLLDD